MEYNDRKLTIGFKDKDQFDEQAVKDALKTKGFAGAELLSGP